MRMLILCPRDSDFLWGGVPASGFFTSCPVQAGLRAFEMHDLNHSHVIY